MKNTEIANELERNKNVFRNLLDNMEPNQFIWRPEPGKWCLLEILCHLYDEEREDFRARTKHILETPQEPMPAIDPVDWVTSRSYMTQDYAKVFDKFMAERDASIDYVRSLNDAKWDNVYMHPVVGPIPASLILHNWIAHDYLHFRQIIGVKYHYLKSRSADPMDYAGTW